MVQYKRKQVERMKDKPLIDSVDGHERTLILHSLVELKMLLFSKADIRTALTN